VSYVVLLFNTEHYSAFLFVISLIKVWKSFRRPSKASLVLCQNLKSRGKSWNLKVIVTILNLRKMFIVICPLVSVTVFVSGWQLRCLKTSVVDVLLLPETIVLPSVTRFSTETVAVACRRRTAVLITTDQNLVTICSMPIFHSSLTI